MKVEQTVRRCREALVLSNEQRDTLRAVLACLPKLLRWFDLSVAQRKRLLAAPAWRDVRAVVGALRGSLRMDPLGVAFEKDVERLSAEGVAPPPLLDGRDLIRSGLRPGPLFKHLLARAYDAQLEGRVTTREEAIELAKEEARARGERLP